MLVSFKQNCKYTNSVLLFVMEEVIFIFFVTSIFPLKKKKMQSLSLLIQFMLTHCLLNFFLPQTPICLTSNILEWENRQFNQFNFLMMVYPKG